MYFIFCNLEDLIALIYLVYFRKYKVLKKISRFIIKKNDLIVFNEFGHTRISWVFNLNHNLIEIKKI